MHSIIRCQIQLLIKRCELILAKGDLTLQQNSHIENALFYLRQLL
jgi:hypothetical protein